MVSKTHLLKTALLLGGFLFGLLDLGPNGTKGPCCYSVYCLNYKYRLYGRLYL